MSQAKKGFRVPGRRRSRSGDLITLRGAERIRSPTASFANKLANPALLEHARPDAQNHPRPQADRRRFVHAGPDQPASRLARPSKARSWCGQRGDPLHLRTRYGGGIALNEAGVGFEIVPGVNGGDCSVGVHTGIMLTDRR